MAKQKKVRLPKGVDETFVEEIQRLDVAALKERVVQLQAAKETEVEDFKKSTGYLEAKSAWEMVNGPVKDTATAIKNKTKMILDALKEKGGI